MIEEERICAVLYKRVEDNLRYAVLERKKNWEGWELVKGHIEGSVEETVRQEVEEEAGIEDIEEMEEVEYDAGWSYEEDGEKVQVRCDCFFVQVPSDARITVEDNPDDEHKDGYFLNFRDARDILTHENQRELLEKAHQSLTGDSI